MNQSLEKTFSIPHNSPELTKLINSILENIEQEVDKTLESCIEGGVEDAAELIHKITELAGAMNYDPSDLMADIESHLREQCDWRYKDGYWIGSWLEDYCR